MDTLPRKPKRSGTLDRRLLGTWRSDKRETFREWLWLPNTPAARKRKLKNMFGKLRIRFTPRRIELRLRDWKYVGPYEVLGSDIDSIAIRYWDSLLETPRIHHLHFVKQWYWVTFGNGRYREWFRRVERRRKSARTSSVPGSPTTTKEPLSARNPVH